MHRDPGRQNAVPAYLTNEQILPFGFAERYIVCVWFWMGLITPMYGSRCSALTGAIKLWWTLCPSQPFTRYGPVKNVQSWTIGCLWAESIQLEYTWFSTCKNEALAQCWSEVGLTSTTLDQHQANVGPMPRTFWLQASFRPGGGPSAVVKAMAFKFQRNKMFLLRSLAKIPYCGEPP